METTLMKNKIALEGAYNFRDIGGYEARGGKKIRYGKLYRSDELSHLTENDVATVTDLGLKTIIDYRNERERTDNEDLPIPGAEIVYLNPVADIAALASSEEMDTTQLYQGKITAALAKHLMTEQNRAFVEDPDCQACYRQMFQLMLDPEKVAILQHCRGGKDRTGYGIALIMGVLGVSREDIMKDYLLTNEYKKEKNETSLAQLRAAGKDEDFILAMRYMKEADEGFLNRALDLLEERGGIYAYVNKTLGITEEQIDRLEEMYLD